MNAGNAMSFPTARTLRIAVWLGCLALAGVAARGIWPVVPVEGDEQGVLFGVEGMVRNSDDLLSRRYLYSIQPGSYQLLAALSRLTGASAENVFAVTTVAGAALFATGGAWLLSLSLSIPFACALLAMLWCQETVTAACYLNTNALAGAVALFSLVPFACAPRWPLLLLGAAGLGFAGWLRGDALLVAPAVLPLLAAHRGFGSGALRETAIAAAVTFVTFAALREISGASLRDGLAAYASLPHDVASARTTRDTIFTVLSPGLLVLGGIGLGWLVVRRHWLPLSLALAGVLPVALAYRGALVSSKYLYYAVPFALVPGLALGRALLVRCQTWPRSPRHAALAGLGFAAAVDLFAGVRVLPREAQYFSPAPSIGAVPFPVIRPNTAIHLGGGDVISNEDGFRLRTGHVFAPEHWRREKTHQLARLAQLRAVLARETNGTLYFAAWLPDQLVTRELFLAGFTPRSEGKSTRWRRGPQLVDARFLGHVGSPYQAAGPAPLPPLSGEIYLVGLYGGRIPPTELADGRRWRPVSLPTEGFVTLYRRD